MFCFIEQANTVIFASSRAHLAAKLSVVILFVSFLFELCKYSQEKKISKTRHTLNLSSTPLSLQIVSPHKTHTKKNFGLILLEANNHTAKKKVYFTLCFGFGPP